MSLPAFVGVSQLNTLDSPRGIPRNHSLRVPVEQNRTTVVTFTKQDKCCRLIQSDYQVTAF